MTRNRGLTLLELMAVMLIMALLAGAAILKLSWQLRAAQWQDVLEQVELTDRSVRLTAEQTGKETDLVLDLSRAAIGRSDQSTGQVDAVHSLPGGYRVEQVRQEQHTTFGGRVVVPVDADARSETYALKLSGPENRNVWIVFSGLSGEPKRIEDEGTVQAIFRSLSRHDAR